jgi:hypothetical protein
MYQIQISLEQRHSNEKIDLDKAKDEVFLLTNKLQEKENFIMCLKKEVDRGTHDKTEKKVFVCDPSRNNVDINNELNSTRDILAKISKMLNVEKTKNEKLAYQMNQLTMELTSYKNNTILTSKCCGGCSYNPDSILYPNI